MRVVIVPQSKKAYFLLLLSMLFYGVSFPATKSALEVLGPITIVTFRLIISSIFLILWSAVRFGKAGLPRKQDIPVFFGIALMQPLGYFLCETFGLLHLSSSVASVLIATIPVITPIFARVLLGERITRFNYIGLFISFFGVLLLMAEDISSGAANFIGVILIFGAVFTAVFYTIFVRKLPHHYSPVTITATQNVIGLLMFLPLFFIFEFDGAHLSRVLGGDFGYGPVLSILFLAIFASSLAFIFMNYGIRTVGPSKANGFTNLIPGITALTSFLFFGEQFPVNKILGMVIVIFGVLLSQRGSKLKKS